MDPQDHPVPQQTARPHNDLAGHVVDYDAPEGTTPECVDDCPACEEQEQDRRETERAHTAGNHQWCGVTCETEFPSDVLRNTILCRAIPGSPSMLAELERRAAQPTVPVVGPATADPWPTITRLVAWLDNQNGRTPTETALRLLKVTEEAGEAASAWIGMTGQNPRKGITHTTSDVADELCDVITAAMVALATISPDPAGHFDRKIAQIAALRLDDTAGGEQDEPTNADMFSASELHDMDRADEYAMDADDDATGGEQA